MINNKSVLAVVPARSGSKGLKHKNIRQLDGKPLLAWSILSALSNPYIDEVVLSTDSPVYADIGRSYGATVPSLRPCHLASDTASSSDVILHVIDEMSTKDADYQFLVLLEPTSPLRTQDDINCALHHLAFNDFLSAVGVCKAESIHPSFMFSRNSELTLSPFLGVQPSDLRRQDIQELFYLEGSIYATDIPFFRKHRTFYHSNTAGVEIPYERSFEVDSLVEFLFIESMLKSGIVKLGS